MQTLDIDRTAALFASGQRSGFHALIVGVSAYPDLPEKADDLDENHFGLRRLTSPCLSAFRLYQWLLETSQAGDLSVPLATVRVLLTPSPVELQTEVRLAHAARATPKAFKDAARAWRDSAAGGEGNLTLFYFCGHGVERTLENPVGLLEGVGQDDLPLHWGFELGNIRQGMAPSESFPNIARKQLYFFDACRSNLGIPDKLAQMNVPQVFGPETYRVDHRTQGVFYAAAPLDLAVARPGESTLFGEALLECLKGDAADHLALDGAKEEWLVTAGQMHRALHIKYKELRRQEKYKQLYYHAAAADDVVVCRCPHPDANIRLEVAPPNELYVKVSARHADDGVETAVPVPIDPHPLVLRIKAGHYAINAELTGRSVTIPFQGKTRKVLPPLVEIPVTVA